MSELKERGRWIIDFEKKEITQVLKKEQIEELKKNDNEYTGYTEVVSGFSDVFDLISFLLPFGFSHKDFNRLEATYLQQHLPVEDMWMSIATYMRVNNVSRATVYNRINAGQLDTEKNGKFTFVKERDENR